MSNFQNPFSSFLLNGEVILTFFFFFAFFGVEMGLEGARREGFFTSFFPPAFLTAFLREGRASMHVC